MFGAAESQNVFRRAPDFTTKDTKSTKGAGAGIGGFVSLVGLVVPLISAGPR
jgi:hypothetical protein